MNKVLILDIETAPAIVYAFQAYDVNIGPDHVIEPGRMICFAAKWLNSNKTMFWSEWTHTRNEMLQAVLDLLTEADAVVSYHGDGFDLPYIRGQLILAGFQPPPPLTSIDLLKVVKKFGFMINKLAFIGPLLGVGEKLKNEGFTLWKKVLEGDLKACKRMQKYNVQDVIVTEKLYRRVLPYIFNHPHLGDAKGACGTCGSDHVQNRGWRRTKFFKVKRMNCQSCGSWFEGTRIKIA